MPVGGYVPCHQISIQLEENLKERIFTNVETVDMIVVAVDRVKILFRWEACKLTV